MHVFIAGVMQGSRLDPEIDSQDYRVAIVEALKALSSYRVGPGRCTDSVGYDLERLQTTFIANTSLAAKRTC